ncbi:MAG: 16S rRNA (uracil(1498)-N(3))-methyltransferase [Holosporales bacterium]
MAAVAFLTQGFVLSRHLPRLYCDVPLGLLAPVVFVEAQAHYVRSVMRLKEGDAVRVFNGREGEYLVVLSEVGKKNVHGTVQQILRPQSRLSGVHLAFVPIKPNRLAFMLEKAVELGVASLTPVISQRCQVRDLKVDKLKAHIIEASEQCERLDVPYLYDAISLEDFLKNAPFKRVLAADERRCAPALLAIAQQPGYDGESTAVLVGPEGGFSEDEFGMMAAQSKITPFSLGETILRAETAALAAIATLHQAMIGQTGLEGKA